MSKVAANFATAQSPAHRNYEKTAAVKFRRISANITVALLEMMYAVATASRPLTPHRLEKSTFFRDLRFLLSAS
jgi:hypothetical protein